MNTDELVESFLTESLRSLVEQLNKLPGIGPKSAERLAFHILKSEPREAMALADAIKHVKTHVRQCQTCRNLSDGPRCAICSDPRRDHGVICVVEQPKDVLSIEKTGAGKWVYHVLGGHISPLEDVEPEDLTIEHLVERVREGGVREVIMATNPNIAGDGTSLYITSLLKPTGVKMTRLARGVAAGSTIDYANTKVLTDALEGRRRID